MSACGFTGRPPRDSAVSNLVVSQRFLACQPKLPTRSNVFANGATDVDVVVTLPLTEISTLHDGAAGTTTTWPLLWPTTNFTFTLSQGLAYAPLTDALGTLVQWTQVGIPTSGTYSLRGLVAQTSGCGIYTVYVDGTATDVALDLSAAAVGFVPTQWNGIALVGGYHDIALVNTAIGLNGAGTNLSLGGSQLFLVKTA